jgi:co-chaperonin GroES (HSP10)
MKVKPVLDKVLVLPIDPETKTNTGLVLPLHKMVCNEPKKGLVLAVGPGVELNCGKVRKTTVKKHDIVLYTGCETTEVEVNGGKALLMAEVDIIAVVDKKC